MLIVTILLFSMFDSGKSMSETRGRSLNFTHSKNVKTIFFAYPQKDSPYAHTVKSCTDRFTGNLLPIIS